MAPSTTRWSGSTMRAPVATRSTRAPDWASTSSTWREEGATSRSRREGTRLDLRRSAAASMSRRVAPESPPRTTWPTGLPARSRTGRTTPSSSIRSGSTVARSREMTSSHGAPGSGTRARWALERRWSRRKTSVFSSLTKSAAAAPTWGAMPQRTARSGTERRRALGPANSRTTGARCSCSMRRTISSRFLRRELQGDVPRAHERADPAGEVDLHAARRAHPHGAGGQRLPELRGRDHQHQHADAADGAEAGVVREGEPGRGGEALQVDGAGEADARAGDGDVVEGEVRRDGVGGALVDGGEGGGVGDAPRRRRRRRSRRASSSSRRPGPRRGRGRAPARGSPDRL